jgi:hypothetical protein
LLLRAKIQLALKINDQALLSLHKAFEEWRKELKHEELSRSQETSVSLYVGLVGWRCITYAGVSCLIHDCLYSLLDFRSRAMSLANLEDGTSGSTEDFSEGPDSKDERGADTSAGNKQTIQLWLFLAEVCCFDCDSIAYAPSS